MFSAQALITAAVVAGVATAALAIFTAVWYSMDQSTVMSEERLDDLAKLNAQVRNAHQLPHAEGAEGGTTRV